MPHRARSYETARDTGRELLVNPMPPGANDELALAGEHTALELLRAAADRDHRADRQDSAARARDLAAEARDEAMSRVDRSYERDASRRAVTGAEIVIRAAEQRRRAEEYRARTVEHRALAARDRAAAAEEREQAGRDRLHAAADRELLARELWLASNGTLPGVPPRDAVLRHLDREVDRCRRCGGTLVVACVTVVGAHATQLVGILEQRLRSYDLVMPRAGDEMVCALYGAPLPDAQRRVCELTAELDSWAPAVTIRAGVAELGPDDSSAALIARAERAVLADSAH